MLKNAKRIRVDATVNLGGEVRQELKAVAQERLDYFGNQGIRGDVLLK